ncbi:MAG TPA: PilZ domain-containing protein [Planctomycetota bacterium]
MAKRVQVERRKSPRISPPNARVWCVSGEFEELYTTVNFAKRLVNLSLKGACVETAGRLRQDLKMSVEVRFDDLNGTLRSEGRIVWAQTLDEGGANEVHMAGIRFQGPMEITKPVRDFMEGERSSEIIERRRAEYVDLKRKKETTAAAPRKRKVVKTLGATLVLFLLVYVASYGVWILRGNLEVPGGPLTYRYLKADPDARGTEEALARFYFPLYWLFRKCGLNLVYSPP